MEHSKKAVKTIAYIAGGLAIISALMVTILMVMSAFGLFYPRKTKIILHTDSIEKIYDAASVSCTEPTLIYGALHDGHKLVTTKLQKYEKVGEYENKPAYMIVDASDDDVTELYNIEEDFGKVIIHAKPISIYSPDKHKTYDGQALVSDGFTIMSGMLLEGHRLESNGVTRLTEPGDISVEPLYSIRDKDGVDVTDQYDIVNSLGHLVVKPIGLTVKTPSKEKNYDGTALFDKTWESVYTPLLEGHTLAMNDFTEVTQVGSFPNEATPVVTDASGKDVTYLYDIQIKAGTLQINTLSLEIATGSMTKEYDGTALSSSQYTIKSGKLLKGHRIEVIGGTELINTNNVANNLTFRVLNAADEDVTDCYTIKTVAGRLEVTPRAITIRTGSATKKYDGEPLICETYNIVQGKLCEGETVFVAFSSLINVGYSPNYIINLRIQSINENGNVVDITSNYSITYDYGQLKITAS